MCNNLVIVKPYLVLIPSPAPDVPKACSLARQPHWRTITRGFRLPCFSTSSRLLGNGERDFRAVILPGRLCWPRGGIYRRVGVVAANSAWPRVSASLSQSIPGRAWRPSSQRPATLTRIRLWETRACGQALLIWRGWMLSGAEGVRVTRAALCWGSAPAPWGSWQLSPWLLSLPCPTGAPRPPVGHSPQDCLRILAVTCFCYCLRV